jgi:hypothetical protein
MWAERIGGTLVDKVKTGTYIEAQIIAEEKRLSFVTRERFLNPEHFCNEPVGSRATSTAAEIPDYLAHVQSGEMVVEYKGEDTDTLGAREFDHLRRFWFANPVESEEEVSQVVTTFNEVRVNGILIRTESFEAGLKTRDSVVGVRYEDEDDEEKVAYGVVQAIIKSKGETLIGRGRR